MSLLEPPRIAFRGRITWDPITTNNRPSFYDEATSENVTHPSRTVDCYRAAAIEYVTADKGWNWNPDGTHRSTLFETQVVSVDLGAGPVDDALVGSPVTLSGMLVDLEPYGAYTSQLFFDAMAFGIDGGCQVRLPRHERMTDRNINFGRNPGNQYVAGGASVWFQTAFPKAAGMALAVHDSAVLAALERAFADDDVLGLTVRWCAYRTTYYDTPGLAQSPALAAEVARKLQRKLEGGGFQPNPARSEIAGTLGLWRRGEPVGVASDRALLATGNGFTPGGSSTAYVMGTAQAWLGPRALTLDLSNSTPESDYALTKVDFGPIEVVAVDDGGSVVATLGTVPYAAYDRAAYDRSAGLVTVALDEAGAAAAAKYDLALRGADGTVWLREAALRVCPDEPNLYVDQDEAATMHVRVRERGAIPPAPRCVALVVPGGAAGTARVAVTDADGIARFPIQNPAGAVDGFVLVASVPEAGGGCAPPAPVASIDPQANDYVYVRTLPADADVAALAPTWDNVFARVLAEWNAMAPCMDNWLRLNDPVQIRRYGAMVRRLTEKGAFESFRYMPVTRDLSPGKRALLYAWLDAPPEVRVAAAPAAAAPESPAAPLTNDQRSRAHRGG